VRSSLPGPCGVAIRSRRTFCAGTCDGEGTLGRTVKVTFTPACVELMSTRPAPLSASVTFAVRQGAMEKAAAPIAATLAACAAVFWPEPPALSSSVPVQVSVPTHASDTDVVADGAGVW
jgi:hypothetical protein